MNTIGAKKAPGSTYMYTFDVIQGVEGILISFNKTSEIILWNNILPQDLATNKTILCILSGDKNVDVQANNDITHHTKNLTIALNENQRFRLAVPQHFQGYVCLFLISEAWQEKYTNLATANLPAYYEQVIIDAKKIATVLHESNSDKLKEVGMISELLYRSLVKLTTTNTEQDTIDAQKIEQVAAFLIENITRPSPSLTELAQMANMSVSSLKVKFKSHFNVSIKHFFINAKMRYARSLLEQGKRIKEVATLLGYKAPQSFSNAFHRTQGLPPSSFKNIKLIKE